MAIPRANIKVQVGPNGEWTAEMDWDDVDRNGPSRLVIYPTDPDNRPSGGLSQTVLREIDIAGAVELARKSAEISSQMPEFDWQKAGPTLARLSAAGISDRYLAVLALVYSASANLPKPLQRLANLTGKSQASIKNHLWQATRKGLLERSPGRSGGAVTVKALDLLHDVD
jgi:hypothetical protein